MLAVFKYYITAECVSQTKLNIGQYFT